MTLASHTDSQGYVVLTRGGSFVARCTPEQAERELEFWSRPARDFAPVIAQFRAHIAAGKWDAALALHDDLPCDELCSLMNELGRARFAA